MCVFCDIANKKIETSVVYENNNVMAFLDYEPINEGHILLISKKHYLDVDELPAELLKELMETSQKLVTAVKKYINRKATVLCKMEEHLMMWGIITYIFSPDIPGMDLVGMIQESRLSIRKMWRIKLLRH